MKYFLFTIASVVYVIKLFRHKSLFSQGHMYILSAESNFG